MRLQSLVLTLLATLAHGRRLSYTNQFALRLSGRHTDADADTLAQAHGFHNLGQIGSLRGYYLFEHPHVRKRSLYESKIHHVLRRQQKVRWVQQQREKKRVKRDIQEKDFPDPLYRDQWYLNGGAKGGLDMNVVPAWSMGYTGKGVVVSILDDGIQTNHPDLAPNFDPAASADINDNDTDPTPRDNGDNKHGTRCAGEVAAVAFNSFCGVGVAYNARIGGVRMLDGIVNDAVEARALSLNPGHVDVYSASWGPEDDGKTVDGPGPLARRAFLQGVNKGRQGRGSIFVWASGNGGRHTDSCNCDGYTNSIFTLSISSATQAGYKPWYLEECSSSLATTYSSGTPGHDRSVVTVDMDASLRKEFLCTREHTGTSASAPLAAGIVALALEANPRLSWRDIQHIVVLTSRWEPLKREQGWNLNGVGRKVSHKFGYGLMDAAAMATMASKWTTVPQQRVCRSPEITEDRQIDAIPGASVRVQVDVRSCDDAVRFLEHVQCKVSLRFAPRGSLRLVLTSPSGTASTLLAPRPIDDVSSSFEDWPFLSVHFWGEPPQGRWTLGIFNDGPRQAPLPGVLRKWQLVLYGTATTPVRLRSNASAPWQRPTLPSTISDVSNDVVLGDGWPPKLLHSCDAECDAQGCYGKGPDQCVGCRHFRLDKSCVSRCPPRSFPSEDGVCWPCHDRCDTCTGAGPRNCVSCGPALFMVADRGLCERQCPPGYYEDPDQSNVCSRCTANCMSCQDKASFCISCGEGLFLHQGTCQTACPPGTFKAADNITCTAGCEELCLSCSSPQQCLVCAEERLLLDGACIATCPAGHSADLVNRECLRNSSETVGSNSSCPQGWYSSARDCLRCPQRCVSCSSALACTACVQGLHLEDGRCKPGCSHRKYSKSGRCALCHETCTSCFGPEAHQCITCGKGLLLSEGSCISECLEGSFVKINSTICQRCHHQCLTCHAGGPQHCLSCPRGVWLSQAGLCEPCGVGEFFDPVGMQCGRCDESCLLCAGPGPGSCLSCRPQARLNATLGRCVPCCGPQDSPAACCSCSSTTGECIAPSADRRRTAGVPLQEKNHDPEKSLSFKILTAAIICVSFSLLATLIVYLLQGKFISIRRKRHNIKLQCRVSRINELTTGLDSMEDVSGWKLRRSS